MKPKSLPETKRPPLTKIEHIETDPETGGQIRVELFQRGVLACETRHYDSQSLRSGLRQWSGGGKSTRDEIEEFCNHLRDQLERRSLPSDRMPSWLRVDD